MSFELIPTKKQRNGASISSSSSDEDVSASIVPLQKMAPARLHNELLQWRLSAEQLQQNGYPFWDNKTNQAVFQKTMNNRMDWVAANDYFRKCARCQKGFYLNRDGTIHPQKCTHHHRPKWDQATGRKRHPCCNAKPGPSSTAGCMVEDTHVFNSAWEETLWEFVTTPLPNAASDQRSRKVYGLDCELVHTLNGLEVARASLVDMKGKVLLDTFVLPIYNVISYNSTFSGVTEKDMETAISLEACRLQLFQYINASTLLVGHSLESDLKALRIVHHNVIDTSVLFSLAHPSGTHIKLSLQTLARNHLGKCVQLNESGHSSVEDSITCMELLAVRHSLSIK